MAKPKQKPRRVWRTLAMALGGLLAFLFLFVVAFVFNPFEGSLPDLRDIVPRGVDFFVRKEGLADDFEPFPQPKFWPELSEAAGFVELQRGSLGQQWQRSGAERALADVEQQLARVRTDSGSFLDVLRDVIGSEVAIAGYQLDYSAAPPRPLGQPWWCLYTRVNWRVKALHGLAGFGFVQSSLRQQGLDLSAQEDLLVLKAPGLAEPLLIKRHLDVLMVANHPRLLQQTQLLLDGNREEEPIGRQAAYTDGAQQRIDAWARAHAIDPPNVVDFVVEPNAFDGFRRFAAGWPSAGNRDSMNERVLASFLNLKGWMQVAGGVMFADRVLAATGQVGLNSKQHTPFQSSFYRAEQEPRERWLDPFLKMVPESACAAAALRMPAGEFMQSMFDALEEDEKTLLNDSVRRTSFMGTQLNDVRDLIERVKIAFRMRTGFVFRQNDPDLSTHPETGELMVPVSAKSPVPQVAWVFWLDERYGGEKVANEFVTLLRTYAQTFRFRPVWQLKVPLDATTSFKETVSEFCNPMIPGTGEIAMVVFSDFFVLSNSGPLIRDILRTRYGRQTGARSMLDHPEFKAVELELAPELNGLVWVNGPNLLPVFDDYMAFAEAGSEQPDQEWMMQARAAAEDQVRRTQFSTFASKSSMPKEMVEPGGQFDVAVANHLREQWRKERSNFTAEDRVRMQEARALVQLLRVGCLQLQLENNYIRFQARLVGNW